MISGPDSLVRVLAARLEELRRRSEALAAAGGDAATLKGHLVPAAHMQRVQAALSKARGLFSHIWLWSALRSPLRLGPARRAGLPRDVSFLPPRLRRTRR